MSDPCDIAIPQPNHLEGYLYPKDSTGERVEKAGRLDWDEATLLPLADVLHPGMFAIDCGACFGAHTKFYSEQVGPDGLVLALEPCLQNLFMLRHNVAKFPHANVHVLNTAVGHRRSKVQVKFAAHDAGETCVGNFNQPYSEQQSVSIAPLDELVPSVTSRKVDFIKFDIEGWEYSGVVGAMDIIRKDKPVLLIEINHFAMERTGVTMLAISSLLSMLDYTYSILQLSSSIPEGGIYDILCKPAVAKAT